MRNEYLEAVNKHLPFKNFLEAGNSLAGLKEKIIETLDPYIIDKVALRRYAIDVFANEALSVGILITQPDWKAMLDLAFSIRESAIAANKAEAIAACCFFEEPIREAQRKFSLGVTFERQKDEFSVDEFAHEIFINIGFLTESTIQPFLKELYCLAEIARNNPVNTLEISRADFGKVIEKIEKIIPDQNLVAPKPWSLRLSQWRNISQHQSYQIAGQKIVVTYGKSNPPKQLEVTRTELFFAAKELTRRLGILKSSRELTIFNYGKEFRGLLPPLKEEIHTAATELGASFNTQGFQLESLNIVEDKVVAKIVDVVPNIGLMRHIHCSQFIVALASRFPGKQVSIHFRSLGHSEQWSFTALVKDLENIMQAGDPLAHLADIMIFDRTHE